MEALQNMSKALTFENLEKPVQQHLKKVYSTLSICMLVAALGAYVHLYTHLMQAGLLTMIGSIGLLIYLSATTHSRENNGKRFAALCGFSLCSGIALGPLLQIAIRLNPAILPTALLATFVVFISFSLSALLSNQKQWILLGGTLLSGMSWLLMLQLANMFLRIQLIYDITLYGGLILMCGFVLYDTQMIVEKRRRGDDDFIWHSVELFIDFINLFRRILIILANKENNKKNRRE